MALDDKANSFLRMIRSSQRGRLKVYLGYCAGVGKTYQMLLEGHRLRKEGVDVVVGLVESHGREDTARLADGLEVVPRLRQEYRGVTLEEMDADAVLARKPAVVLVDELAHTNVPGSRNKKRYEDVQDILEAGIHVITTLNVQHLESLYDTVESAVGIKVRERLPDSVLMEADQIVNVDVTTQDLRRRLEQGKIYPVERIQTALGNFFTGPNLEQLREIALRELASQIDSRRRAPDEQEMSLTPDQVMVCLSSAGPNSDTLLRYASRLAGRLNRNWYALYVQTPSEEPTAIDAETQRVLAGALTLAKQLGAMVFTYKGEDIPDTILRFAREYQVGHIVVGSPSRLSLWDKLRGRKSVVERLMEDAGGITVVVLDTHKMDAKTSLPSEPPVRATVVTQPTPSLPMLTHFLSPGNIIIWDEPVLKEEVLNALAKAALSNSEQGRLSEASQKIWEREQLGSTFFNEGVAFPHARLDGLALPRLALGLTRHGIVDVTTEQPIESVFLILTPAQSPTTQLQMLALTSKAAQNRHFLQRLRSAPTPDTAMKIIEDWERMRDNVVP
ncbi:MAG TPA: PTS sugar transporter subunit IIA [Candidatus Hydrogenedentes bacterium]|nr:PTS sugar transporter subunit IIA [Candidatus Hydrogenedentota bacterium]HOS02239.1 PTS sugar transporter subunit IIA [Candidatus Hydrogenedentota bacterium]